MGKAGKGKGAPANMKDKGKVVTDPRFARMHTDARFQVIPRKQRKVQLDERFQGRAAVLPEWSPICTNGLALTRLLICWIGLCRTADRQALPDTFCR